MTHIVILGAGLGGVPMAYEMRAEARSEDRITVVSNSPYFQFVPSNPWVAVGRRKPGDIKVGLKEPLAAKGIDFIDVGANRVHPAENRIELNAGEDLRYDHLIIATGPELAFDEVPGLGPVTGYSQSICHVDHAARAADAWETFLEKPGPVVIGAVQGASCFGPAYEFAFIVDAELRKRRLRDRVPMTFVTSEPYIGHLGLGGVGDSRGLLESAMRQRHIQWICNARVERVEEAKLDVIEHDERGHATGRREIRFDLAMLLPAFRGIDAIRGIEGLTNARGFVLIDRLQRNPAFANVWAVGVCVAIPPIEATPIATGVPKTGYMIESMVRAVALNVRAVLDGRTPSAEASWNAICLADMGDTGIAFVAMPEIPPRNVAWIAEGRWVHLAKVAFEKYFLRKVRRGATEPVYEKYVLDALGITKLKS
jgi:sulfide:quinone oxidoreductase